MIFVEVKIVRDNHTQIARGVPPWEIPVLEMIYEGGNVERTGKVEKVDRPYPEVEVELHRLTENYGGDRESKQSYVSMVYGQGPNAVRALAEAIREAEEDEREQMEAGTAPKVHFAPVPAIVAKRDPLLA